LKPISQHCYDLARGLEQISQGNPSFDWLEIASAIKNVDIDLTRFDNAFGWCSDADHYQLARQTILKSHITNLTVFFYVWGALEATIDSLSLTPHPDKSKQGKVNSACHAISTYFDGRMTIAPYHQFVGRFSQLVINSDSYKQIASKLSLPAHIKPEAFGLYIVYKLRNEFAHGNTEFPRPDCENEPNSDSPVIVEIATRITLFCIQMLYLTRYAEDDLRIDTPSEYDSIEIQVGEWLRTVHFEPKSNENEFPSIL
jgi:hypothetical protein